MTRRIWIVLSLLVTAVFIAAAAIIVYAANTCPARLRERMPSTIQADPALGYTLRSDLAVRMPVGNGEIHVYTNPQGIRVGTPGAGRINHAAIVAVGDSQTFGNVEYPDSYPALLGKALGVSAVNLGVSGYGLVSAIERYEHFAALKPQVVVLGFYFDSLDRALSPCYPGITLPGACMSVPHVAVGEDGAPRVVGPKDNAAVIEALRARFDRPPGKSLLPVPSRDFCWSIRTQIVRYLPAGGPFSMLRSRGRDTSRLRKIAEFLFARLNGEVVRNGGRLIVLYIPNYAGAAVSPAPAYLRDAARDLGVPFLDLTPVLKKAKEQAPGAIMIPADGHLTPWANTLVAQALADEIRRSRLLAP